MILKNKDVLVEVVYEIMDEMFFLFPEINEEGQPKESGILTEDFSDVGIHFNTEHQIRLRIEHSLLEDMTVNFTGLQPEEIQQEHLQSTATETANIIGGNFLVKIDPEQTYKLSIPELLNPEDEQPFEQRPWQQSFVAEEGKLLYWPEARR